VDNASCAGAFPPHNSNRCARQSSCYIPASFEAENNTMQILKFIFIMLEVLVLFNIIIFVHELGHFLAARWRGLKVQRFAIWFGKPLWKKKIGDVEYALGCIPAGGYVMLPQMAPMEALEGKIEIKEPLPPISALDKIIVAFAGPLFSFLLALLFAVIVWWAGKPVSEAEATTVIGYVEKGGPADVAGLRPGDKVLEVDGKPVSRFLGIGDTIMWQVVRSEGETIPFKVERNGEILTFHPKPVRDRTGLFERKSLRQVKIAPAQPAVVDEVIEHSPAAVAGIKKGDVLLEVDGETIFSPGALTQHIKEKGGQPIRLMVRRGDEVLTIPVTPRSPDPPPDGKPLPPMVGISYAAGKVEIIHPTPLSQIVASIDAMVSTIGALFSPKSDISPQHLSGPVKILNIYYLLFNSDEGWRLVFWFTVLLNVNLALLNLLPLPVLDGGHITLAIMEAIRRRPVSARVLNVVQTACAVLVIGFMLYIAFFDVQELPWRREKQQDIRFSPPPQNQ
jgi:regulator of sigma E protease